MRRLGVICGAPRFRDRESGQAMVEFILVLLPLVVFVGGIIQLGIGIANWHDLNRIANEGARFAATEEWPGCPASTGTPTTCNGNPACTAAPAALVGRSLVNYLRCEAIDAGLPASVTPVICGPNTLIGSPITVKLESRTNFLSLDGNDRGKISWAGVTLRAQATMRLEVSPTKFTVANPC